MPKLFLPLTTLLLVSSSNLALSAPATPEEAGRVKVVLESYLGQEPGVVTVTPSGETYELKLDFQPYLNKAASIGGSVTVTPYILILKPEGGGIWTVTQDSPFSLTGSVVNVAEFSFKIGQMKGVSTFDEAVGAFTTSRTELIDLDFAQTVTVPNAPPSETKYSIKNTVYKTKVSSAPNAAIDGTMVMTSTGYVQSMQLPGEGENPVPVNIDIAADSLVQTSDYKGLKARALTDLVRWFLAHPNEDAIKKQHVGLKNALQDTLPVFDSIKSGMVFSNMTVTTPMGPVTAAKVGVDIDANGAVKDGLFREAMYAEGLTLPPGLVPPFAANLVPEKFSLDFTISGYDLAAPAALFLAHLEKTIDPPGPEFEAELLKAFMPTGDVTITLAKGNTTSKILDIGYEGSMKAGTTGKPSGQGVVTAKGFDEAIAELQKAPPEMGMANASVGLLAAKGFSKPDAASGGIVWNLELTPEGGILVNGIDVSKIGK
jgi:hypothetical protein